MGINPMLVWVIILHFYRSEYLHLRPIDCLTGDWDMRHKYADGPFLGGKAILQHIRQLDGYKRGKYLLTFIKIVISYPFKIEERDQLLLMW